MNVDSAFEMLLFRKSDEQFVSRNVIVLLVGSVEELRVDGGRERVQLSRYLEEFSELIREALERTESNGKDVIGNGAEPEHVMIDSQR